MPGEEIYIARLGAWLARALGNTGSFATDLDTEGLGFQMPDSIVTDNGVMGAGKVLSDAGDVLRDAADKLDAAIASGDQGELITALIGIVEGVYLLVDAIKQLVNQIDAKSASLPEPERNAVKAFCKLMARKIIDYLVITLLEQQLPRLAFLLKLLGLIDWRIVEASGALNEPRYVRKDLRLERIKDLFSEPAEHFAKIYGWGTADFDPSDIMRSVLAFHHKEAAIKFGKVGGDAFLKTGPFRWSRDSTVTPPGLLLDISANVSHSFDERVEFTPEWGMDFESTLALEGGAFFRLKPPFEFSVEPKNGTASGAVSFMLNRNATARGFTIIGGNDLIHLTAENIGIGANLTVGASTSGRASIDPGVSAELKALTLSLGSAGSDNFLASLLAQADIKGDFDIGLGWTLDKGLVIKAAGGLEIAIPMHQSLGIVRFETLYIILKIRDDGSFALETSASITGQLGPLSVSVERTGVEVMLAFSNGADARLGPVDLQLRFKPPNGLGLNINAGAVKGGGYLFFDFEKEEYAGVLELTIAQLVSAKAIGLITTKMPDGSKGFSMLIIITAEFMPPFQLGYGFTLIGVGGLLGLNRTVLLDPLRDGVRTGSVNSIMFPQNVVANAPRIISDLKAIFPPFEARFLIGPMGKLGYGTPTLISLSLGIIIEIPGNIAILGVLGIILPDEKTCLIKIQVAFVGTIDFDKKMLTFDASLFESSILSMTLEGDMAVRLKWGDNPDFLITVGGFHPSYTPPPLALPTLRRLAINILNTSIAKIRVECYQAVTSNTVQFGAKAEIYFDLSVCSIKGHIGFDALFQFSPFYFIIEISASFSLSAAGIDVISVRIKMSLEGPTPWRAKGTGSVSLFFFDISADFDKTWGEDKDTSLPDIEILPTFIEEISKREQWSTVLSSNQNLLVSLRKFEETESSSLVLHPAGSLEVQQKLLPLRVHIDKVGNQKTSDIQQVYISKASIKDVPEEEGELSIDDVNEDFALAQYQEMSKADKLSRPSFQNMPGGVSISMGDQNIKNGKMVRRKVEYEKTIIDKEPKKAPKGRYYKVPGILFANFLKGNSVSKSVLSQSHSEKLQPFKEKLNVQEEGYTVSFQSNNMPFNNASTFTSEVMAQTYMQTLIRENKANKKDVHVVPNYELQ